MRRYPLPATPHGWYRVSRSAAVAVGEVRPLRFFGRDLVLLRDEAGVARLFDAYCPHLGAHLGHGGRVVADGIRCPFHGWRFDGGGTCVEVPRLRHAPPKASLRAYPVDEMQGMIFAWYHACDGAPSWRVPRWRDGGGAAWTEWQTTAYQVRTHVQDMAENILDHAHFYTVHDIELQEDRHFEARFEGPHMIVEQALDMTAAASAGTRIPARTVNSGPGISATTYAVDKVELLTLLTQTPVEENLVDLLLAFSMRKLDDAAATAAIEKINRDVVTAQFAQDIPIWEHKIYREHPVLTAIDGPIPKYRRWFRQFYSELTEPKETPGERRRDSF